MNAELALSIQTIIQDHAIALELWHTPEEWRDLWSESLEALRTLSGALSREGFKTPTVVEHVLLRASCNKSPIAEDMEGLGFRCEYPPVVTADLQLKARA